jgi:hypothetical protein
MFALRQLRTLDPIDRARFFYCYLRNTLSGSQAGRVSALATRTAIAAVYLTRIAPREAASLWPPLGGRFNVRIGAQYFIYTKFSGAISYYDGTGRSASNNNAFRLFTWLAL